MLSDEDLKFWIMGLMFGISGKPYPLAIPDTIPPYVYNETMNMLMINDPESLSIDFDWSDMKMNAEVKN